MRLKTSKATLCGGNGAAPSSHAIAPHLLRGTRGKNRKEGVEGGAPLPGDFRVIVCLNPPQINDFC
jgi:hypothetical protein